MELKSGGEGGEKSWRVDGKGFVLAFTMGPREVTRHTVGAAPRGSLGILWVRGLVGHSAYYWAGALPRHVARTSRITFV